MRLNERRKPQVVYTIPYEWRLYGMLLAILGAAFAIIAGLIAVMWIWIWISRAMSGLWPFAAIVVTSLVVATMSIKRGRP